MKTTLDFNGFFKQVDGTDTDVKLSKSFAEFLASETTGDALKLLGFVEDLNSTGCLELDQSDKKALQVLVEGTNRMVVLLKGQILRVFL